MHQYVFARGCRVGALAALTRKRDMSREAQNEAAKIHLAASIRLGDWLRNHAEKASGAREPGTNRGTTQLQVATASTYVNLGIEKTDAFRVQRLYDWENSSAGGGKR
jgi:hypothetical protein